MPHGLFVTCRLLLPAGLTFELRLGDGDGCIGFAAHRGARATLHSLPYDFRHWLIDGAGMGFLLSDAELGQHVDDGMRGDLKLPGELIDSNFTHN
jgi:hypothetical protein